MQKKAVGEKKVLITAKVHPKIVKSSKQIIQTGFSPSFSQYVEDALSQYNLINKGLIRG